MCHPIHDIPALEKQYAAELERLKKTALVMSTVASIGYIYHLLSEVQPELTIEFMMENEALTSALVNAYGRLFSETDGTTQLNKNIIPKELLPIHDELMKLRNGRYAHHGDHHTVETELAIVPEGDALVIRTQLQFEMCLGAPKTWGPLFDCLAKHLHDVQEAQTQRLSKTSGIEWRMADGPPPPWIDK